MKKIKIKNIGDINPLTIIKTTGQYYVILNLVSSDPRVAVIQQSEHNSPSTLGSFICEQCPGMVYGVGDSVNSAFENYTLNLYGPKMRPDLYYTYIGRSFTSMEYNYRFRTSTHLYQYDDERLERIINEFRTTIYDSKNKKDVLEETLEEFPFQIININELFYRPPFIGFGETVDVCGEEYWVTRSGPKVFVMNTDDVITEKNVSFVHGEMNFDLYDIIHHTKNDKTFIECRYWVGTWTGSQDGASNEKD